MPFGQSVNMDGSFAASSAAFGLMGSSWTRRSYAAAAGGRELYSPANLSASLASLTTNPMGSLSHSYTRGHLETMMNRRNEAEYTKEYDCCGVKHNGLHALLEHVEDQHPYLESHMPDAGFSPVTLAMDLDLEGDLDNVPSTTNSTRSSTSPRPVPNYPLTPTTTNVPKTDAPASTTGNATTTNAANGNSNATVNPSSVTPLQLSDVLKSPAGGEASSLPGLNGQVVDLSSGVPKFTSSASRGAFLGGPAKTGQQRFDRAFNEVVAGKAGLEDPNKPPGLTAVAPSVLFTSASAMGHPQASAIVGRREGTAGSGSATPAAPTANTSGTATPATPTTATAPTDATATTTTETKAEDGDKPEEKADTTGGPPPPPGAPKLTDPPLPPPSLFTTHKAWRCPNPGCNKAYKQSNGLKYHLQKGQCDFAIHDAIDHGLTLEEAEERARPYVCAVGAGCTKRYRQMNGLKVSATKTNATQSLLRHADFSVPLPQFWRARPIRSSYAPERYPPSPSIASSRSQARPYPAPQQRRNQPSCSSRSLRRTPTTQQPRHWNCHYHHAHDYSRGQCSAHGHVASSASAYWRSCSNEWLDWAHPSSRRRCSSRHHDDSGNKRPNCRGRPATKDARATGPRCGPVRKRGPIGRLDLASESESESKSSSASACNNFGHLASIIAMWNHCVV